MVAIIENWATIVGTVVGITPAEPGQEFLTLSLRIERIEPYEQYPMLLQQKPGDRIAVRVRPRQVGAAADLEGSTVSIRVRRGRDVHIVFAAPDWTAGAGKAR